MTKPQGWQPSDEDVARVAFAVEAECNRSGFGLKPVMARTIAQAAITAMQSGWQPIESAPRDGTVIDIWRDLGGRDTVYWGRPPHECGEMGQYCDSDWHANNRKGWVCGTFGQFIGGKHNPITHWRYPPPPPQRGDGG